MSTRGELSAALWGSYAPECPSRCRQYKISHDCKHALVRRKALDRDEDVLLLLLDLRDLLAEAMLVRALVASDLTMTEFFDNLRNEDGER